MKRPRLSKKRALRAASSMEIALPGMVDYLQDKFYDESEITVGAKYDKDGELLAEFRKPRVSLKEKTIIASFFARTAALKEQVMEEKGLNEKHDTGDKNPLILAVGGNIAVFKSLPAEKRRELLLKAASGELVKSE